MKTERRAPLSVNDLKYSIDNVAIPIRNTLAVQNIEQTNLKSIVRKD